MAKGIGVLLILAGTFVALAGQKATRPPACQDEEALVTDYEKSLTELVGTVRKESLEDFQRTYHRKSCLIKLNLCAGTLEGAVACFDKASQDRTATKQQISDYKTKHDSYSKLRDKVSQYRDSLKAVEVDKDAKALIEKFDF